MYTDFSPLKLNSFANESQLSVKICKVLEKFRMQQNSHNKFFVDGILLI